jgi:hypothetical protein
MTARPDPDLFAERDIFGLPASGGAVPNEVLAGLAKLAGAPPLWGTPTEWLELVERVRAWTCRWHGPATDCGGGRGRVVRPECPCTPGQARNDGWCLAGEPERPSDGCD